MAQTLLSGDISTVYDKLLFRKDDGTICYTNIAGDADVALFSNLEDTALSTWAGTTNVVTLGTVTTGTWNATTVAVAKGGSGQTSYTNGQLLIGNTSGNTLAKGVITGTANEIDVTLGGGTIQIGLPNDVTIGGDLTITGEQINFPEGGIIDGDSNRIYFRGENTYGFKANFGGDLNIDLIADGAGSPVDINRLRSANGGTIYFENYEGSSYSTSLAVDKDGKLKLGGNIIQNSDGEDTLTLDANQKLSIEGNVLQNSDAEDTITLAADQSVSITNELTVTGNKITFGNGGYIHNNTSSSLSIFEENVYIGTFTAASTLALAAGAGTDGRINFIEGIHTRWSLGCDATDDSYILQTGISTLGGAATVYKTLGSTHQFFGESAAGIRMILSSNTGAANGDNWSIRGDVVGGGSDLGILNDISGSAVAHLRITPHATVASSTVAVAGSLTTGKDITSTGNITSSLKVIANKIHGIFPLYHIGNGKLMKMLDDDVWYSDAAASSIGSVGGAPTFSNDALAYFNFIAPYQCKLDTATIYLSPVTAEDFYAALWKVTWTNEDTAPDTIVQLGSNFYPDGAGTDLNGTKIYRTSQTGLDITLNQGTFLYWTLAVGDDTGTMTCHYNYLFNFIEP